MLKFWVSARKYLIGALIGIALVFGSQVLAAGLIGKEVQGEITVVFDGTELSTTGIIVDGTSYLPLRAIGTVLGLGVDYVDGKAILNTPEKENLTMDDVQTTVEKEIDRREKEKQKQELKAKIADIEEQIAYFNNKKEAEESPAVLESIQMIINQAEDKLTELRVELAQLEAE